MKLIGQSFEILKFDYEPEKLIELAGRTCYKSEDKITKDSANRFVRGLIKSGHHSVIEHANATVRFITNRGVTHELVRHRLASYSQESTRYCNYGGQEMEFIKPVWYDGSTQKQQDYFVASCIDAEIAYNRLLKYGWKPEQAREVLPNALKTEIVVTANFREWWHIFKLRCSKAAHPQIRALMIACRDEFISRSPVCFWDLLSEV